MKKIFISALAVLLFTLLCSCESTPDTASLSDIFTQPYDAELKIQNGDDVYIVSVRFDESGLCFSFSEPALLRGVSYIIEGAQSSIVYNGISIPVDLSGAQDKMTGGVFAWKKLLQTEEEYTVRRTGEQYVMTDGKTEYRFDKEEKTPVYITSGDINITFISFKAKNDKTS